MEPLTSDEGHAFIAVDSFSKFPVCYLLTSLTAKAVCDVLLELRQFTGCSSYVFSDLGTNFTSQLTKEFEKRLGCSPRFNCPFHPSSTGLTERGVGNVKHTISKLLAMYHTKQWHKYVPMTHGNVVSP